jgi:hypothetical protein
VQDIGYALRSMAGNPLFASIAVLSLALGIGANTAIYSFMEAILMRSLPVNRCAPTTRSAPASWVSRVLGGSGFTSLTGRDLRRFTA